MDTSLLKDAEHHEPFEKPGAHLFWILSGHGTMEIGENKYLLQPGNSVWLVDLTKTRTYAPAVGQLLEKRGIRFGGPALENWHKQFGASKRAQFDLTNAAPLHKAFLQAWRISERKRPGWEWQMHLILTEMLGILLQSRDSLSATTLELPSAVVRVLNAVESKPFYDWKVRELALLAGVSYSGLRTLFSEALHENLHSFVQRRRLEQAEMLLSDHALSIKQVAQQMNFSSEFYFSHFFKKLKGMNPRDFRAQH